MNRNKIENHQHYGARLSGCHFFWYVYYITDRNAKLRSENSVFPSLGHKSTQWGHHEILKDLKDGNVESFSGV